MMRRRWDYFVQAPAGRRAAERIRAEATHDRTADDDANAAGHVMVYCPGPGWGGFQLRMSVIGEATGLSRMVFMRNREPSSDTRYCALEAG